MLMYLWVVLGSALGGVARYGCALLGADLAGDAFPWGTIFINVLGSFVIGFFATVTGTDGRFLVRSEVRVFVMIGICGGYTTFSSFSLQTFLLIREGHWLMAVANVAVSMVLCLVIVWVGHASATSFSRPPRGAKKARR